MPRRYLTPGAMVGHVVVLIAVLVCLRLGWWQWNVSQLPRGTMQNLGYAVLWPVFAGSFIYMWLRFLQLESQRIEEEAIDEAVPDDARELFESGDLPDGTVVDGVIGGGTLRGESGAVADPGGFTPGSVIPGAAGHDDTPQPRDAASPQENAEPPRGDAGARRAVPSRTKKPDRSYTVGVGYIGEDVDDELAAYNRALAALAEQDEGRAR